MLEHTRNVTEHTGAAALAAALAVRGRLAARRVVWVMSGGNLSLAELRRVLG